MIGLKTLSSGEDKVERSYGFVNYVVKELSGSGNNMVFPVESRCDELMLLKSSSDSYIRERALSKVLKVPTGSPSAQLCTTL